MNNLEAFESTLRRESEAFTSRDLFGGLHQQACQDWHDMAGLESALSGDGEQVTQAIRNCQQNRPCSDGCFARCVAYLPPETSVDKYVQEFPDGINAPVMCNGENVGQFVWEDRRYGDNWGNEAYLWRMSDEAFDIETPQMHELDTAFQSASVNVMGIVTAGLADSIHIVDVSNADPRCWTFDFKGWTGGEATKQQNAKGKRVTDCITDILSEMLFDSYLLVKLSGDSMYDRISRTVKGKRLEYTRRLVWLENDKVGVFTRHEPVAVSSVH